VSPPPAALPPPARTASAAYRRSRAGGAEHLRGEKTPQGGEGGDKVVGPTDGGVWRASKNGSLRREFGGPCKMQAHLKGLLELYFCMEPSNFRVEAYLEALAGDALS
jgi:hypothetical protein